MKNIYCTVRNAPDPDEPAESGRCVSVDLLCRMPFPSLNLYKQKRIRLLFSSYSLHILGMAKPRKKKKANTSILLQCSTSDLTAVV